MWKAHWSPKHTSVSSHVCFSLRKHKTINNFLTAIFHRKLWEIINQFMLTRVSSTLIFDVLDFLNIFKLYPWRWWKYLDVTSQWECLSRNPHKEETSTKPLKVPVIQCEGKSFKLEQNRDRLKHSLNIFWILEPRDEERLIVCGESQNFRTAEWLKHFFTLTLDDDYVNLQLGTAAELH